MENKKIITKEQKETAERLSTEWNQTAFLYTLPPSEVIHILPWSNAKYDISPSMNNGKKANVIATVNNSGWLCKSKYYELENDTKLETV